jgi:hypothetical protein
MDIRTKWLAGSAKKLEGASYMLTVFITEGQWDYLEKRRIYDKIFEARKWLVHEAKRYGKNISIIGGHYGLNNNIIMDNIPVGTGSGKEPTDIVTKVLQKIGYINSFQFLEQAEKKKKCDNVFVLVIANKTGRGYAIPFAQGFNKETYFLEGTILYKNNFGSEIMSAEIAHEILHLFGAWDLYTNFLQSSDRELKARQLFPDDIMLRTSRNINDLKIDKLTAWLVGLTDKKEDYYEWFKPKFY